MDSTLSEAVKSLIEDYKRGVTFECNLPKLRLGIAHNAASRYNLEPYPYLCSKAEETLHQNLPPYLCETEAWPSTTEVQARTSACLLNYFDLLLWESGNQFSLTGVMTSVSQSFCESLPKAEATLRQALLHSSMESLAASTKPQRLLEEIWIQVNLLSKKHRQPTLYFAQGYAIPEDKKDEHALIFGSITAFLLMLTAQCSRGKSSSEKGSEDDLAALTQES